MSSKEFINTEEKENYLKSKNTVKKKISKEMNITKELKKEGGIITQKNKILFQRRRKEYFEHLKNTFENLIRNHL